MQKKPSHSIGRAGEQHQSFYFGTPPRQLNGIVDTATGSPCTNFVTLNAGLGFKVRKSHIEVARPYLGGDSHLIRRRQFVIWSTTTFAETSVVQGENVYSRRG